MSLSTNTTYRVFVEKLGGTDPAQFVGDAGEVFLDPNVPALKLSDGSTAGGISIGGTGGVGTGVTYITAGSGISVDQNTGNVTITATGGGGGGETYWVSTAAGIHTLSNVGVGTTNPTTKLQVGGVLGFGPDNNIRIGDNNTGANLTSGIENIFIGSNAGRDTTDGVENTFIGSYAGTNTNTGTQNSFFGSQSGRYNTSGSYNSAFGLYAGFFNTDGNWNNFFGYEAGRSNTSGSYNIFLGSYTGISTSASNKVIIGRGRDLGDRFDAPDTTKDIQFAVGIRTDANPSKYWLVGNENFNVGIGTTNPTSKLTVQNGDIKVGVNTSNGVILTDANGVAWRLIVNTDGTLATAAV